MVSVTLRAGLARSREAFRGRGDVAAPGDAGPAGVGAFTALPVTSADANPVRAGLINVNATTAIAVKDAISSESRRLPMTITPQSCSPQGAHDARHSASGWRAGGSP